MSSEKLRPGFARIEFISIEDEAAVLFKQGHTLKSAYDHLYAKKKLSMKYDTFRRYAHALTIAQEAKREEKDMSRSSAVPSEASAEPRVAPKERKTESPPEESGPRRVSAATVAKDFRKPARSVSELLFGNTE